MQPLGQCIPFEAECFASFLLGQEEAKQSVLYVLKGHTNSHPREQHPTVFCLSGQPGSGRTVMLRAMVDVLFGEGVATELLQYFSMEQCQVENGERNEASQVVIRKFREAVQAAETRRKSFEAKVDRGESRAISPHTSLVVALRDIEECPELAEELVQLSFMDENCKHIVLVLVATCPVVTPATKHLKKRFSEHVIGQLSRVICFPFVDAKHGAQIIEMQLRSAPSELKGLLHFTSVRWGQSMIGCLLNLWALYQDGHHTMALIAAFANELSRILPVHFAKHKTEHIIDIEFCSGQNQFVIGGTAYPSNLPSSEFNREVRLQSLLVLLNDAIRTNHTLQMREIGRAMLFLSPNGRDAWNAIASSSPTYLFQTAIEANSLQTLRMLLKMKRVSLRYARGDHLTILASICKKTSSDELAFQMIKLLLPRLLKIDVNIINQPDAENKTAIDYALERGMHKTLGVLRNPSSGTDKNKLTSRAKGKATSSSSSSSSSSYNSTCVENIIAVESSTCFGSPHDSTRSPPNQLQDRRSTVAIPPFDPCGKMITFKSTDTADDIPFAIGQVQRQASDEEIAKYCGETASAITVIMFLVRKWRFVADLQWVVPDLQDTITSISDILCYGFSLASDGTLPKYVVSVTLYNLYHSFPACLPASSTVLDAQTAIQNHFGIQQNNAEQIEGLARAVALRKNTLSSFSTMLSFCGPSGSGKTEAAKFLTGLLFDNVTDRVFQCFNVGLDGNVCNQDDLMNFLLIAESHRKTKHARNDQAHTSAIVLLKGNRVTLSIIAERWVGTGFYQHQNGLVVDARWAFFIFATERHSEPSPVPVPVPVVGFPLLKDEQIVSILKEHLQQHVSSANRLGIQLAWPSTFVETIKSIWDRCHNFNHVYRCVDRLKAACLYGLGQQTSSQGTMVSIADVLGDSSSQHTFVVSWTNSRQESNSFTLPYGSSFDDFDTSILKARRTLLDGLEKCNVTLVKSILKEWTTNSRVLLPKFLRFMSVGEVPILQVAVSRGCLDNVRLILELPSIHDLSDPVSLFPFACQKLEDHVAAPITKLLLEYPYSGSVHDSDKDGNTALHWAVSRDLVQTARLLSDHNADWTVKNRDGSPAAYGTQNEMSLDPSMNDMLLRVPEFHKAFPTFFNDYISRDLHDSEDHVSKTRHILTTLHSIDKPSTRPPFSLPFFQRLLNNGEFFQSFCNCSCVPCLEMILDVTQWDLSKTTISPLETFWTSHHLSMSTTLLGHKKIAQALRLLQDAGASLKTPLGCEYCASTLHHGQSEKTNPPVSTPPLRKRKITETHNPLSATSSTSSSKRQNCSSEQVGQGPPPTVPTNEVPDGQTLNPDAHEQEDLCKICQSPALAYKRCKDHLTKNGRPLCTKCTTPADQKSSDPVQFYAMCTKHREQDNQRKKSSVKKSNQ